MESIRLTSSTITPHFPPAIRVPISCLDHLRFLADFTTPLTGWFFYADYIIRAIFLHMINQKSLLWVYACHHSSIFLRVVSQAFHLCSSTSVNPKLIADIIFWFFPFTSFSCSRPNIASLILNHIKVTLAQEHCVLGT